MNTRLQQGLKSFERKQIVASGLALLFIVGLSLIFTFLYRSGQAAESAKLISRMIRTHDRREIVLTLQDARLDQFQTIRYVSTSPGASFTLPELADLMPDKSPWRSLVYHTIMIPVGEASQERADVFFEFNRFSHVVWGVLAWVVINLISIPQTRMMRRRIVDQYEKDLEIDKKMSRLEIANIVRHNIRTPLSALMRLSDTIQFRKKEEAEVFQSVITQIRELISKLDAAPPASGKSVSDGFFESMQAAARELRIGLPDHVRFDVSFDDSLPSALVSFVDSEMKALVGNLVNNAAEAIQGSGEIHLEVRDIGYSVLVRVKDNGKGIPSEILERVTEKGFTFGKKNGTGIGLFHAAECAREWGGNLRIQSTEGVGTLVELQLPVQGRHPWYVSRVKLHPDSVVAVVDDQVSVHRLWKMKLEEAGFSGRAFYFNDPDEFLRAAQGFEAKDTHFFVDYDFLDARRTGIDLLKELPTESHRYLVTGHFDDASVRLECQRHQLSLIPKTELSRLPLVQA